VSGARYTLGARYLSKNTVFMALYISYKSEVVYFRNKRRTLRISVSLEGIDNSDMSTIKAFMDVLTTP
jgi:hypothetical protein